MIEKTIKRDPEGRFERHGKTLAKTAKKSGLIKSEPETKASMADSDQARDASQAARTR